MWYVVRIYNAAWNKEKLKLHLDRTASLRPNIVAGFFVIIPVIFPISPMLDRDTVQMTILQRTLNISFRNRGAKTKSSHLLYVESLTNGPYLKRRDHAWLRIVEDGWDCAYKILQNINLWLKIYAHKKAHVTFWHRTYFKWHDSTWLTVVLPLTAPLLYNAETSGRVVASSSWFHLSFGPLPLVPNEPINGSAWSMASKYRCCSSHRSKKKFLIRIKLHTFTESMIWWGTAFHGLVWGLF